MLDHQRKIENKAKKTKTIGPSVFTLIFWVCPFVALWFSPFVRLYVFSGFSDVPLYLTSYSIKLIYAYHQYELNEGIKMICFICRFSVYFSRNHRKCSQNGKDGNSKNLNLGGK